MSPAGGSCPAPGPPAGPDPDQSSRTLAIRATSPHFLFSDSTKSPKRLGVIGSAIEPCTAVVTGPGGLSLALAVVYSNNVNVGTASASASYAGSANYLPSSDTEVFVIGETVETKVFVHLPFMSK